MTLTAHHTGPGEGPSYEMTDGVHVLKSGADRTVGAFEVFSRCSHPVDLPRRTTHRPGTA